VVYNLAFDQFIGDFPTGPVADRSPSFFRRFTGQGLDLTALVRRYARRRTRPR
jgi:hypothetical protein